MQFFLSNINLNSKKWSNFNDYIDKLLIKTPNSLTLLPKTMEKKKKKLISLYCS